MRGVRLKPEAAGSEAERVEAEGDTVALRLLAAAVAIPVFELSLYLALGLHFGVKLQYAFLQLVPLWVHALYVGVAALVGLSFGFKGITWLLGHLFWTHFEHERNLRTTLALWVAYAVLIGIGFLASR